MKRCSYRDLKIWQKSRELNKEIYRIVKFLPREELFGLSDQMRRSSISVMSNIAEGHGRLKVPEFITFLGYARGSLYEVESQCISGYDAGYFTKEQLTYAFQLTTEITKMLNKLLDTLENDLPQK